VRYLYTGAAPLGSETVDEVIQLYPKWHIGQGYGMTETATVICSTSETDRVAGTSGSLVPCVKGKLVDPEGN
jgi:long-subunit acyl-CoA synthetase (AMP-forming)